jgi:hypothetical protein
MKTETQGATDVKVTIELSEQTHNGLIDTLVWLFGEQSKTVEKNHLRLMVEQAETKLRQAEASCDEERAEISEDFRGEEQRYLDAQTKAYGKLRATYEALKGLQHPVSAIPDPEELGL